MHPATHATDHAVVAATTLYDDHLTVSWHDGPTTRFHYQWLRDNCRSEARYDHVTGERIAITEAVPPDLGARAVSIDERVLRIDWSDTDESSVFDPTWLRAHAYDDTRGTPASRPDRTLWDAGYAAALERFDHASVLEDDATAAAMIEAFERTGLVLLQGMPTEPNEVERFANHFAYVREIAFDRVADIRVKVDPYTLGFTSRSLPLHTDCSGYSWPPNVMVFHCLRNDVAGGASCYVDGTAVVEQLRERDPEALRLLSTHKIDFRLYSRQADTLSHQPPVTLGADGKLAVLRHANWTTQPLATVPFDEVPAWYDAYRAFAALINDPANVVQHRCEPGEAFLIDNHRVLHGRAAFDADEGVRHFQQVYMEADDLSGRRRLIESAVVAS